MKPVLLAFLLLAASHAQIVQQIVTIQAAPSGASPPSNFAATASVVAQGGSFTFAITVAVAAGQGVAVALGVRGSTNFCSTITGITATGGDTFTQSGNVANGGAFEACAGLWTMMSPTPNATYVITLAGGAGSPATFPIAVLTFDKNSLVGTADPTCNNKSAGTTTMSCTSTGGSGAITPTGTIELGLVAGGSYDNLSGSEADGSTPAFTLPAGAQAGNASVGAVRLSYYTHAPPAGTLNPGFTGMGSGDPVAIWGAAFK